MRIKKLSSENPKMEFKWLIQHFTKENLICCFHALDGKKAVGIDGRDKDDYAQNLEENVERLVAKMKKMSYYPAPVREVKIPKSDGKLRPLGISTIEDKMVQSLFEKILSAIYEPLFVDESYGFREGRSCHDAIKDAFNHLSETYGRTVIDVDLSNFFGTINHRKLIMLLEMKIKDPIFIRYIVRMLKAGILTEGELKVGDDGTPQGSIASPVLANIFLHHAIDIWVRDRVFPVVDGKIHMVRYADDIVLVVDSKDAARVMVGLKKRLERFSLALNESKTKVISFCRRDLKKGLQQGVFKFLGFTFYFGKSRKGKWIVKIKTAKKTYATKLRDITSWCRECRNKHRLAYLWKIFQSKIRGHIQYYGVSHNGEMVEKFVYAGTRIFFKWINRRSQRKSFNWDQFNAYMKLFPLPKTKIVHRLF
jgi:group II intron reverse transcriptase/maturase